MITYDIERFLLSGAELLQENHTFFISKIILLLKKLNK